MGITFSASADLKAWRDEVGLGCDLLCDANRAVAMSYGAADSSSQEKANRVSVLIRPGAQVAATYSNFDPAAHAETVLAEIRSGI